MRFLTGLLTGLMFGVGLIISGMANPAKVQNFLDIAGNWDPSLAFVMAGAVVVTFIGYRLAWRSKGPALASGFDLPTSTTVDGRLLFGAVLFGLGWGIGGFCPGPAVTALAIMAPGTIAFVIAMLAGLWLGPRISSLVFAKAR